MLWRYKPKADQYTLLLLSFLLYRRVQLLGVDEEFEKTKNATIRVLKDKLPLCKRFGAAVHIVYFHTIVIAAVVIFLTMLVYMAHNFINVIS